ncbi:MAG: electron transfer flavoprotein subunit alpha/FixB family protein [Chitinophagales bacterium]
MSILVYAESFEGKIKKQGKEAVAYAAAMGDATALVLGTADESELSALGKLGVSKVLHVNDERLNAQDSKAYTKAIAEVANQINAEVIVMSFNSTGKAVAPRLSARLKAGLVSGASDLPDTSDGFVVKKGSFSGKGFAFYKITTDKKIITINPNSFPVKEEEGSASVEAVSVDLADSDFGIKVVSRDLVKGGIPLPEAELVVSAGRGLKGPENWGMIEEMAEILGAATACSRPVSDVDWRPHHEHVGQTGITISPNLYIAVAISGAIQHLAGVSSSKTIVVINNDSEAPFFKHADYGIVGDAFEVVPKLNEALKKFKESNN